MTTGILESCDRLLFNSDHKRQIYDDRNFTQHVTMENSFLVENERDMRFISSLRPQQLVFLDGILIEIQINFHWVNDPRFGMQLGSSNVNDWYRKLSRAEKIKT